MSCFCRGSNLMVSLGAAIFPLATHPVHCSPHPASLLPSSSLWGVKESMLGPPGTKSSTTPSTQHLCHADLSNLYQTAFSRWWKNWDYWGTERGPCRIRAERVWQLTADRRQKLEASSLFSCLWFVPSLAQAHSCPAGALVT